MRLLIITTIFFIKNLHYKYLLSYFAIQSSFMMKNTNSPYDDLKHIRQMMEESSKFLSLSGLSGVAVGAFALIGAAIAYFFVLEQGVVKYDEYVRVIKGDAALNIRISLIFLAAFVFIGALGSAWIISLYKSRKEGVGFWTPSAKKMVSSLFTVLFIGGVLSLIFLFHGYVKIIASIMLVFYGLGLLNCAKYSKHDLKLLAYTEIGIGIIAAILVNYGLLLWTIGFGIVHIVYGVSMYFKYERESVYKD
jgi:hypothetical protein